jgi:hypothetical protein
MCQAILPSLVRVTKAFGFSWGYGRILTRVSCPGELEGTSREGRTGGGPVAFPARVTTH